MNWLKFLFENNLPDKDPKDFTLTDSSTGWQEESYCPTCKGTTVHRNRMTGICEVCGTDHGEFGLLNKSRTWRKIIQNGKWVIQYKYRKMIEIVSHRLPRNKGME